MPKTNVSWIGFSFVVDLTTFEVSLEFWDKADTKFWLKDCPYFQNSQRKTLCSCWKYKGELEIYIVGDDSVFPWRWKIRLNDFVNLQILPHLLKGVIADIMVILGSIDIIMGGVDR